MLNYPTTGTAMEIKLSTKNNVPLKETAFDLCPKKA